MSPAPTLDDLVPEQREALLAVARGDDLAELAERQGTSTGEIADLARRAMSALAGDPDDGVSAAERASIGDYVLGRQSPGQAEGTWELLRSSPAAAQWAERLRRALGDAGPEDPVGLPGEDGALSPAERVRHDRRRARREATLRDQREERDRRRTEENAKEAAAELASPYRADALDAHRESENRIRLPRWAPRFVQRAMYGVLVALIAGLAFCIFIRIPVNTNAVVLVTDVPPGAPGVQDGGGLQVIALFAQGNGQSKDTGSGADVEAGDVLRVALPGEVDRTPMTLRWVSDGPIPARDVIDGYRLPVGQANRVVAPGHVALAELKTPEGRRARSFEGATITEASVETGSRRIISLLF